MRFTWDLAKNERNFTKHGVWFEAATYAFDDPSLLALDPEIENGEYCCRALAMLAGHLLFIAFTWEEDIESGEEMIRLISARRATRKEGRLYHDGQ